jgi:predicted nucleotidyltransferase
MDEVRVSSFLQQFTEWAQAQVEIHSVILVGSLARGDAKPDSDMDLMIICSEPDHFLQKITWVNEFGKPSREVTEDWGLVTSLRVWYTDGFEVEFGFTDTDWIKEPLDAGTKRVLADGFRILLDKTNLLTKVAVHKNSPR